APRTLLPSFLYLAGDADFPAGSLALPWGESPQVAGELARKRGAESPDRLVASAKSWLSFTGANRTSAILPCGAPDEVPKLSPVAASTAYLAHLREAWSAHHRSNLRDHPIVLTVPASFDEEARELTSQAAAAARLSEATLLEEPQAACYAWI